MTNTLSRVDSESFLNIKLMRFVISITEESGINML